MTADGFLHEPGLADPRLPRHQDDGAGRVTASVERLPDLRQFTQPADEGG